MDSLGTFELARQRWTQREIADSLGVAQRTVMRWESGESPLPHRAELALSEGLRAHPEQGRFRFIDLFAGHRRHPAWAGSRSAGGVCSPRSGTSTRPRPTWRTSASRRGTRSQGTSPRCRPTRCRTTTYCLAGFPCQPFSIAGVSKKNALGRPHGFADETQGTLFFDVARIIDAKRPRAFMLENVRNLMSHDKGQTIEVIMRTLTEELGYHVQARVLDASPLVPQGRQRIFIVGFAEDTGFDFGALELPASRPTMSDVLHPEDGSEDPEAPYTVGPRAKVADKYTLTDHLWQYLQNYAAKHRSAGNGFGFGLVGPGRCRPHPVCPLLQGRLGDPCESGSAAEPAPAHASRVCPPDGLSRTPTGSRSPTRRHTSSSATASSCPSSPLWLGTWSRTSAADRADPSTSCTWPTRPTSSAHCSRRLARRRRSTPGLTMHPAAVGVLRRRGRQGAQRS